MMQSSVEIAAGPFMVLLLSRLSLWVSAKGELAVVGSLEAEVQSQSYEKIPPNENDIIGSNEFLGSLQCWKTL